MTESVEAGVPSRLYVVVDGSMPVETVAPQSIHAVTEFALADPEAFRQWHDEGNVCIVLSAEDGKALARRALAGEQVGFSVHKFFEPDWSGGTPSAVVFAPHPDLQVWMSDLSSSKAGNWWTRRKRSKNLKKRWARV